MPDLSITIPESELPDPGEEAEFEKDEFYIFIENTSSVADADVDEITAQEGEIVKYVAVETTAPASVVRHAARVFQRNQRTRVEARTLCDRVGKRVVRRRLDREPLTNVTCVQCRKYLVNEGLLAE